MAVLCPILAPLFLMQNAGPQAPAKPKPSPPAPRVAPIVPKTQPDKKVEQEPPYHVILLDDDHHTYEYVIEMLQAIFGYDPKVGYKMAKAVDENGKVIVATVHKELAELRQEQIHDYGPDPRLAGSKGSMTCIIEPAE